MFGWLASFNMHRYVERFVENGISESGNIFELDVDKLRNFGITDIDHCNLIIDQINLLDRDTIVYFSIID